MIPLRASTLWIMAVVLMSGCGKAERDEEAPGSGTPGIGTDAGAGSAGASGSSGTGHGGSGAAAGGCDLSSCRSAKPCCAMDVCGYDVSSFGEQLPVSCLAQSQPGTQTNECSARAPLCDIAGACKSLPGCRLPDGTCGYWLDELPMLSGEELILHEVKAGCVPATLLADW